MRPNVAKIRSQGKRGAQAAAVSPSQEELELEPLLSPSQPELLDVLELLELSHPESLAVVELLSPSQLDPALSLVSPSQLEVLLDVGALESPSQPEVSSLGAGSPPPQPSSAGAVETGVVGGGLGSGSGTRRTGRSPGQ